MSAADVVGLGYYSAVMAHVVGPTCRVVAVEADESLAAEARAAGQGFAGFQRLLYQPESVDGPSARV